MVHFERVKRLRPADHAAHARLATDREAEASRRNPVALRTFSGLSFALLSRASRSRRAPRYNGGVRRTRLRRPAGRRGGPNGRGATGAISGRGLPTSSPSANPVGGIGGILASTGASPRKLLPLTLTTIGVVYGDIGTSPLYAMRECFFGSHSVPVTTPDNVLGVLSLIIYSLLLGISVKDIAIVMRADNQGVRDSAARHTSCQRLFGPVMVVWFITIAALGSPRWLGSPSCSRLLLTDPAAAEQPFFLDQRALVRHSVTASSMASRYGFMEDPNVPEALARAKEDGLELDREDVTYFLGRETLIVTRTRGMAIWREKLFVLTARNAVRPMAFFRLPPERVVELGVQVEIDGAPVSHAFSRAL